MIEVAIHANPSSFSSLPLSLSTATTKNLISKTRRIKAAADTYKIPATVSASAGSFNQTDGGHFFRAPKISEKSTFKKRVFFLDVNPLCYDGSTPSLHSFAYWVSLFFSQVSLADPVIAVFDGEGGNEHRRKLLPSYKAHRRKFVFKFSKDHVSRSQLVMDLLTKCNVPVVKVLGHEADDVVATLVGQVLQRGYKVVVASPDKDFKQLVSEDVQIVLPVTELKRWSFYTIKHYIAQYNCDPNCDLSFRCIMGDEVDGVPGIQTVAPGFGRKTALKLLKKHGSLENLLNAAAVRTVGKQYAQDALTKHADYLLRNYEVLALRRDVDVHLQEEWLVDRDRSKDSMTLSNFKLLEGKKMPYYRNRSPSLNG
ncbi:uncharacterized protein LOC126665241 [Mercurialis annua]|uniref:uncharacterized protein LOC126665241 n=1 Tax=Mercurialis annua TaxID=3986 RepID=UPI00215F08A1|nr:uncharacterized protein LOC126665241 [Mercurialis annua]XP_050213930.1 uncharacterized protein LOC126665241 [Mercurialis annua]XP_050213931.1 uncharacterized protein LOC126665241 [Mercurialis annua]XP_050213932.1 uncharacterized protein LOC126665241 [Mercurialis annua]